MDTVGRINDHFSLIVVAVICFRADFNRLAKLGAIIRMAEETGAGLFVISEIQHVHFAFPINGKCGRILVP